MAEEHTYLQTHKISGATLSTNLVTEAAGVSARAIASSSGRAAKTLVKDGPLRITLIGLSKGTTMQKHKVDGAATIQVMRGRVRVMHERDALLLSAGCLLVLEAGVVHDATALLDSVMLLTFAKEPA